MISAQQILRVVIPFVYGRRRLMLVALGAITLFMGWHAAHIRVDAGYEKLIPLNHPYMETFKRYQEAFGGANLVSIALVRKDGDIYDKEFLATLKQVTDELFFLPGVDRSRLTSLFTPGVRYIEITEDGIASGDVMPANYQPTPEMLETVRRNVARANVIGRIVSEDQRGAMVVAELLENHPVTGEKLDYPQVAHELERIRSKYQTTGLDIHIIGFAKVVGDVTDATLEVVGFFAITLVLTGLLLWIYCGSFKLALLPLGCSLIAVVWEFGLLRLLGFGIDPFAILVPFLVLSTGVNHGVQMVNSWALEVADNRRDSFRASVATFRRLALPGTAALVTDVSGFATIYLIEIDIIREMALNACLGTAAIIVTNKILMPILLTYVRMRDIEGYRAKQLKREAMGDGLWRALSHITDRRWSITVIVVCLLLFGWSNWKGTQLRVGDFKPGVPELRPDSRYNLDSAAIHANFSIGVDLLKVIVETVPEACIRHDVMEKIDRFAWHLQNTKGVESVVSLPQLAKLVSAGWNEGSLKWRVLPRNQYSLVQSINPIPISAGLQNAECSTLPVLVFTTDHQAETIERILGEVKRFDRENGNSGGWRPPQDSDARQNWAAPAPDSAEAAKGPYLRFALASGNVGVMAATNEVIKAKENPILFWVYLTTIVFVYLSFGSLRATLCIILPLSLVSIMGYALMAELEIGLKVSTLPVVSLAVGIGVDYGIYIYSVLGEKLDQGLPLKEAYYQTLHTTGKAVIFASLALAVSVITWIFSDLQYQVDMGILLSAMFLANMIAAVLTLPALAHFLHPKMAAWARIRADEDL